MAAPMLEVLATIRQGLGLDTCMKPHGVCEAARAYLGMVPPAASSSLKTNIHEICVEMEIDTGWAMALEQSTTSESMAKQSPGRKEDTAFAAEGGALHLPPHIDTVCSTLCVDKRSANRSSVDVHTLNDQGRVLQF